MVRDDAIHPKKYPLEKNVLVLFDFAFLYDAFSDPPIHFLKVQSLVLFDEFWYIPLINSPSF